MKKDQLIEGQRLQKEILHSEKTLMRVETLYFAWEANGSAYYFSNVQLEDSPELIRIFNDVAETAKILLQKQIETHIQKLKNEFDKI